MRLCDSSDVYAVPGHLSVLSVQSKEAEETQVSLQCSTVCVCETV